MKTEKQYQLSGSKNAKIGENVEKLLSIFTTYNVNFSLPDIVYNILAMKILPQKEATCFLNTAENICCRKSRPDGAGGSGGLSPLLFCKEVIFFN